MNLLHEPPDLFQNNLEIVLEKALEFVNDSNFKITLTSLRIVQKIVEKFKCGLPENLITKIGVSLMPKYSDNKIIIRHAVHKTFYTVFA